MPSQRLRSRTILLVGYALLFVAFDATATLFEVAPGVSAWYPSAGLNLALLLVLGARFFPVVFVATLSIGLVIASPSLPIQHLLLPSAIIALSNGAAAAWLRSSFDPDHPLDLGEWDDLSLSPSDSRSGSASSLRLPISLPGFPDSPSIVRGP